MLRLGKFYDQCWTNFGILEKRKIGEQLVEASLLFTFPIYLEFCVPFQEFLIIPCTCVFLFYGNRTDIKSLIKQVVMKDSIILVNPVNIE